MSKLDRTDGTTLTLGALGLLAAIGALGKRGSRVASGGHHFRGEDGRMLADTSFITDSQRVPGVSLSHMGFGEFYAKTPKGRVDFARGGPDFPGKVGRSHYIYGPGAEWLIAEMEKAGLSTLGKAGSGAKSLGHEITLRAIRVGDRVTIVNRFDQESTGSAVMKGPHGWVLNMGGRHGTPAVATADNIVRVRKRRGSKNKAQWVGHGEIYISAPDKDLVEFVADRIEENYFDSDSGIRVSISFDQGPKRQTEEDGSRHWWTGHGEIYIIAPDKDLIPLTVQTVEGLAPENVAVDVAIEQIEMEEQ